MTTAAQESGSCSPDSATLPSSPKRILIGLGSGRCGTSSLYRFLDSQEDATITHELTPVLPWNFDEAALNHRMSQFGKTAGRFVGDVSYTYLPYVRKLMAETDEIRFVCLRRDATAVVESMLAKTEGRNHWVDHDGTEWKLDDVWDPTMPSFPPMPKDQAVRRYLDEYYKTAEGLQADVPDHFRIFPTEALNSDASLTEILEFCGFEGDLHLQAFRENRLLT